VETITPELEASQSRNLKRLEVLVIVGMLSGLSLWVLSDPTSERWGITFSSGRIMLLSAYTLLVAFPFWIWGIYRFSVNQRWLAEDLGVPYTFGKRYPLWTRKRIFNISLGIMAVGLSGLVPTTLVDLPRFTATCLTILHGPIEGGLCAGLSFLLIRGPFFNGITNPSHLVAYCLGEGMVYLVAGQFYREYINGMSIRRKLTIGLLLYVVYVNFFDIGFIVPGLFWGVADNYIGFGPLPVSLARRVWQITYWLPTVWVFSVVGAYLTATVLQRYKA
jgi:hypothetical protein